MSPTDPTSPAENKPNDDSELARRQAIAYGRDLARIYTLEKEKRDHLELAFQLVNAVFANTPEGMVVVSDEFRILQTNVAFNKLVETTAEPDKLIGELIEDVLQTMQLVPALQRLATDPSAPHEIELTLQRARKTVIIAQIGKLQAGQFSGWVIACQDQSRQRRLDYQKSEFITIAADELSTPLNRLLGRVAAFQNSETRFSDDDFRNGVLSEIGGSLSQLSAVVGDLLRFAEINEGDVEGPASSEVSIEDLIGNILADLRSYADDRLVTLQSYFPVPIPTIQIEYAALRRVLYQLVLNGINFNHSGGYVRIEAREEGDEIIAEVMDTGIGIPEDDIDLIFQPFFRVNDPLVKQQNGLGLGLSIARKAVDRLGGDISVRSGRKTGTTFVLRIPKKRVSLEKEITELREDARIKHQQAMVYAQDLQVLYRQLQKANAQLKDTNLQLEESNKLKSEFLATIGHELRSPFVGLDGAIQAFTRQGLSNLSSEQQDLFRQIAKGAHVAFQTIDQLVKYTQFVSKQGRLNLGVVRINALIDTVVESLRTMAERKRISLTAKALPGLALPSGDSELISEALWHLIQNAIKFTASGGKVAVEAYQNEAYLVVEVKDTGIGIEKEKQDKIWESFAQIADPLTRGVEGLGLGLPLVKYVASSHNGRVILHSEPGVGSVFGFWLPIDTWRDETEEA